MNGQEIVAWYRLFQSRPKVQQLIQAIGEPEWYTLGLLLNFMAWICCRPKKSELEGFTTFKLAQIFKTNERFWEELIKFGWIIRSERGLHVVGFEKFMAMSFWEVALESTSPKEKFNEVVSELAGLWNFYSTRKNQKNHDAYHEIQALIDLGVSVEQIRNEIVKPHGRGAGFRDRGEYFWQFKKRILESQVESQQLDTLREKLKRMNKR